MKTLEEHNRETIARFPQQVYDPRRQRRRAFAISMTMKNQITPESTAAVGVGSDARLAPSTGDKVQCYVPNGWGGHQGNLLDRIAYSGAGLTDGMPTHEMIYCVRGIDTSCDGPAIYLVGIVGTRRADGTEWSFSAKGFRKIRG